METYVLPGITDDRLKTLADAGIPCGDWGEGNVIVVGEENLHMAAEALNAEIVRRREKDGAVEITFKFEGESKPVKPTATATVAQKRQIQSDRKSVSRANYVKACATRLKQLKTAAQKRDMPVMDELRTAQTRLTEAMRRAHFNDIMAGEELQERFRDELKQLRAVPKVLDVRIMRGGLMFQTDTLYATTSDGSARYEIGRFAIWIRFSGDCSGVYWINRTRRVNGAKLAMQAPYVYANGVASNDAVKQVMHELIGRCEFAALADLAIQYVETVNPDHPLTAFLNKWPQEQESAKT